LFLEGLDRRSSGCKIIVSDHNFEGTPSRDDLGSLVARIQSAGADIVKVVTTANKITDVAAVFSILTSSQVHRSFEHRIIHIVHHHHYHHHHYHHQHHHIIIVVVVVAVIVVT
jgi:3-dehydroquinate dehydratase type I